MEKNQILSETNLIFKDVLDNEDIVVKESTSASEVDEWDSLTHIQLVVAIEKHFKLKFTTSEIRNWNTVGDMIDNIYNKLI